MNELERNIRDLTEPDCRNLMKFLLEHLGDQHKLYSWLLRVTHAELVGDPYEPPRFAGWETMQLYGARAVLQRLHAASSGRIESVHRLAGTLLDEVEHEMRDRPGVEEALL